MEYNYYYLAHYSERCPDLNISPAGNTKMAYIIGCFEKMGLYLNVFSTAETKTKRFCHPKTEYYESHQVKYVASFLTGIHFLNRLAKAYHRRQILSFLKKRTEKDVVIVYHNIPYMKLINQIGLSRKFKLIYEVEEIYSLVQGNQPDRVRYETETAACADGLICVTEKLNGIINQGKKPYAVACGSYKTCSKLADRFDDGRIHCVYAGTLDMTKGGSAAAVAAAEHLNENYRIHILGFGSDAQIDCLNEKIKDVSAKTDCVVTYDGCLSGDAYLSFLQQCHIGLSTQRPDGAFNNTSFPSKIMVYLANGLNVVSIHTDAIASFEGSDVIDFYRKDDPEEIAAAIKRSAEHLQDQRVVVERLDQEFVCRLRALLEDVTNNGKGEKES